MSGSTSPATARCSASTCSAPTGTPSHALSRRFHLAAINRGVYFGQDGEFALATPFTDEDVDEAIGILGLALEDLAKEMQTEGASG